MKSNMMATTLTAESYRVILQSTRSTQYFNYIQTRWASSQGQLSVIRVPVPLAEKLKREKQKRTKIERELLVQRSQRGDQSTPIISCRRKQYNHYLGQSYNKFKEVPLASKGWGHRKSVGDYFTINSYGGNPAFRDLQEGHKADFESLGLDSDIQSQLNKLGFQTPTNVQTLAIPHVLEGKNTLITAETGNGKTLAFIAPMLQQIRQRMKPFGSALPFNSPFGLVIAPGRELAEQIQVSTVLSSWVSDARG
ncbi:probable ATP-dependent RNA helicase DDX28 [Homarus americanus]|uniref:probable ATP-dependent RNA helicase DDX28 n=1 Tax=Homarus americanus TaxID=6706 RepID=UPI001C4571C9|nr:probable ATP-dependent RNA helicase DDX28 [Homarus americanus]